MVYVVILRGNKVLALMFPSWQLRAMSKLRTLRKLQRLSQAEVAAKVGVKTPMISRIEKGQRVPSMKLATRISEFFKGEITPNDFMPAVEMQQKTKEVAQ